MAIVYLFLGQRSKGVEGGALLSLIIPLCHLCSALNQATHPETWFLGQLLFYLQLEYSLEGASKVETEVMRSSLNIHFPSESKVRLM